MLVALPSAFHLLPLVLCLSRRCGLGKNFYKTHTTKHIPTLHVIRTRPGQPVQGTRYVHKEDAELNGNPQLTWRQLLCMSPELCPSCDQGSYALRLGTLRRSDNLGSSSTAQRSAAFRPRTLNECAELLGDAQCQPSPPIAICLLPVSWLSPAPRL